MEEAKHAWASLKSGRKLSNGNSTAVWYDVPAPVIIHCHEFPDSTADVSKIEEATSVSITEVDADSNPKNQEDQVSKRHRNTVELTAIASVSTDEDGVPQISFSFLQTDEKRTEENGRASVQSELYDFPKNPYASNEEIESEKVETEREADADGAQGKIEENKPENVEEGEKSEGTTPVESNVYSNVDATGKNNRARRSTSSFKHGKKSCGKSESDAGIASMSGSYSDPECSNIDALSVSKVFRRNSRGRYSKKHRLGKAWEKMRSWLRDETSKINEVVNKHARLQAVGALAGESRSLTMNLAKSNSASYDLTKASPQETGSITRVEEFGLSTASSPTKEAPETLTFDVDVNANKPSNNNLRKTIASSEMVLNHLEESEARIGPVSFSMDKLCSDTENEETENREIRDLGRKPAPGLIKRRMLGSIRGLMASTHLAHVRETEEGGQGGFEDIRRAELEATYAKGLSKLSSKLTKACAKDQGGNGSGGVNEAWRCVGEEMEAAAEAHKIWGITLSEQLAKPLRVGVAEAQGRSRKAIENSVDKAGKSLHEWRNVAAKSKKQSFASARENERLQDLARLQTISQSQQSNNKSPSHHQMTEKEASKLEARRRKAEDSSRRADTEFYTVSVRAERARLEYESTMRKGAKQMELLEEERLSALKDLANVYLAHLQALAPRLQQSADRLATPIRNCNVSQDIEMLKNHIRRVESNDGCNAEQLLPDFYAEHVTLAMNRERRKQALVRVLHLIRQDLERERRGREGLETLHRAFVATPAFAADESTQNVTEKLHHMRSMLLYLEAAKYKVGGTLAEVEGSKRGKHPFAEYILVSRDKQGLQQSVLKIPSWAKNESFEIQTEEDDDIEVRLAKDHDAVSRQWVDRTAGDGNSENPPDEDDFSDFDEFSSQSEDNNNQDVDTVETSVKPDGTEQCRAIYQYSANLNDELSLSPGDLITVHQKQPDGWWIGECKGRTGIFPATYVQVI
ncbi:uncharacterized protein LOC108631330 isoform X2 [Ceratina calcarata]|uniref:Uncharacterized protein LOC108631330 isoform X2 n=1 Tax=Ceratina calcarata TaxID=156304 RepID=A0AAJ7WFK0_9HYME|nr:uncharacterized protein LOC108631330 isoform X2 [Ceratina calcarata]